MMSCRADTLSDAALDPTAPAVERAPFEDERTVEDSVIVTLDDGEAPAEPPTAKHYVIWLDDLPDDTPAPSIIWG